MQNVYLFGRGKIPHSVCLQSFTDNCMKLFFLIIVSSILFIVFPLFFKMTKIKNAYKNLQNITDFKISIVKIFSVNILREMLWCFKETSSLGQKFYI